MQTDFLLSIAVRSNFQLRTNFVLRFPGHGDQRVSRLASRIYKALIQGAVAPARESDEPSISAEPVSEPTPSHKDRFDRKDKTATC